LAELAAEMAYISSQAEGAVREYAVLTQKFSGENGKVKKHALRPRRRQVQADCRHELSSMPSSSCSRWVLCIPARGMLKLLSIDLDPRGNVKAKRARLPEPRARTCFRPATCAAASR